MGSINYDLAIELAKYLNVEMVPVIITWEEAFYKDGVRPADLETNPNVIYNPDVFKKVDIICSSFTPLKWRLKIFDFAETLNSAELLLTDRKYDQIKDFSDLEGKSVVFMKSTSFETHMSEINSKQGGKIELVSKVTNEEAKEFFRLGKAFGVILDADDALNFNVENGQKYRIAMPITPMSKIAWALQKGNSLQKEVEDFFRTIESNEVLDKIFQKRFKIKYSSYVEMINKIFLQEKHNHDLPMMVEEGELVVGLRERNFVYHKDGEKQFMHALAEDFADYLGISFESLLTPDPEKYWVAENGRTVADSSYTPDWFGYVDLACDVFTPAKWQSRLVNFIPVMPAEFSIVARKDKKIKSLADLKGLKCAISKGSFYEEILLKYGLTNFYATHDTNLLDDVRSGKADYTILNDAVFELIESPDLETKLSLGKTEICWAVRKDQPKLEEKLRKYIAGSQKNGLIRSLLDDPSQSPSTAIQRYYQKFQSGQFPSIIYGAEEGLPQEDIYSIFQDKTGYMWFGTCSGAIRYNGREMKMIGNSQELTENTIRAIDQDSSGYIYLASSKGISVVKSDTIVKQLFPDKSFYDIFIDHSDNKWFIGDDGVIILKSDGTQQSLNKEFSLLPSAVNNIVEDVTTGNKYISTEKGIFCYSPLSNKLVQRTGEECYFIFIDVHGHAWVSTKDGLFVGPLRDIDSGSFGKSAKNLNAALNLDNDIIKDIRTDKTGSVWLIFDTKIVQMTSNDRWATVYDHQTGLKNNKILSALFDREDNLWIGFFGGLQRLSYTRGIRSFFPVDVNSYIYSIQQTDDGRIWVASNNGIFYFDKKLVNFSAGLDKHHEEFVGHNEKYVMGTLPNKDLLFACGEGMYEADPKSLKVIRNRMFDNVLLSLESLFISSKGELVFLTGINGIVYYMSGFNSPVIKIEDDFSDNISQLIEINGRILGGNSDGIVELKDGKFTQIGTTGYKIWSLCKSDSTIWVGTDYGLKQIINNDFQNFLPISIDENTVVKSIIPANNKSYLWLGTNHGFAYFNKNTKRTEFFIDSKDGLAGDEITPNGLFLDRNDLLWIGTYHGVSNFYLKAVSSVTYPPTCFIEKALLNGNEISLKPGQVFRYNQNNFLFEICAISFTDEKSIEFEFYIRGTGNKYSAYNKGKEYKAYYNNLPPGKYEFIYKARGKNNVQSYSQKYVFAIKPAWFNTWLFRIIVFIIVILLIYALYKARVKTIELQKKKLEEQVRQRTHELEIANIEIQGQRDMARSQRDRISEQNKEITDSIYYAERIQRSMLPPVITLDAVLPEHFVLFKPKNIVSGDFYWAFEKGDRIFISAVDCTGHGVPGALMSMLGISFLNEIVVKSQDLYPNDILNNLRDSIIRSLKQAGHEGESRDGMDVSMVSFDKAQTTINFAGANNPLYFIRNGQLEEIKGDKMPVGFYERMTPFTPHSFNIQKGDIYYIFSDGYADQFGGPKSKKFMYANFKKLLLTLQDKSMLEQGVILDQTIKEWQGKIEQIDDIVVIGLRF